MKINLSRRYRAFIAKWGGVVVAAILIIPLAFFGGTFLLANSRIDSTLNFVTQAIGVNELISVGPTSSLPPDAIYRVRISVLNDTPDAAEINLTEASLSLGRFNYDITGSIDWHGRVPAKGSIVFEGDIKILREESRELANKTVPLKFSCTVKAKARYGFVEKEENREFKFSDGQAIIPPPIVVPSTEGPTITLLPAQ